MMKEGQDNLHLVKEYVSGMQDRLMAQIEAGEDLDGSLAGKVNVLSSLYHKAEAVANLFWARYPRNEEKWRMIAKEVKIEDGSLRGIVDVVDLDEKHQKTWIRDYKTTGKSLAGILTGYQYGAQLRVYRMLADAWCGQNGYPSPMGFILDAVAMPGIKMCRTDEKNAKKWDCSVEDAYLQRIKEWYEEKGKQVMVSTAMPFLEPVMPTELDDAIETIVDLSTTPPDPQNFPRDITGSYCMAWDKPCLYAPLCESSPSVWPAIIEEKYTVWEEEDRYQEKKKGTNE
jgi:hypothetical protein